MTTAITRRQSLFRIAAGFPAVSGTLAQAKRAHADRRATSPGMVVSVSEAASKAGAEILARGGNALDAAMATGFALAVTYPAAGNIGGGGFLLVHPVADKPTFFDFREFAPLAATETMFVDPARRTDHRRVGVPGTVRGFALAHQRFGSVPWSELVEPCVRLKSWCQSGQRVFQ